jgi:hypothetical protein
MVGSSSIACCSVEIASFERRSDQPFNDMLLDVSRNLQETDSFGYRILTGQQSQAPRTEVGAFWRTGVGEFGMEAADAFDIKTTRAYARGGVAAAHGSGQAVALRRKDLTRFTFLGSLHAARAAGLTPFPLSHARREEHAPKPVIKLSPRARMQSFNTRRRPAREGSPGSDASLTGKTVTLNANAIAQS